MVQPVAQVFAAKPPFRALRRDSISELVAGVHAEGPAAAVYRAAHVAPADLDLVVEETRQEVEPEARAPVAEHPAEAAHAVRRPVVEPLPARVRAAAAESVAGDRLLTDGIDDFHEQAG